VEGLIVQLISGLVGGNLAGLLAKTRSLGPILNSIVGLLGGLGGGQLMEMLNLLQGAGMGADVGSAAAGGGVLVALLGRFTKQPAP